MYLISMKKLVIFPKGGLGNRIRVIFSYWCFCKKHNINLVIFWKKNKYCFGHFLDYFQEIPGVIFNQEKFMLSTSQKLNKIDNQEYIESLKYLKINKNLQEIIDKYLKIIGKFDAVHIRRTDHVSLAKANGKYVDLVEFERFIEGRENVFLATDCYETQRYLMGKYKQVKVFEKINYSKKLRQTSLRNSVIDMFICIEGKEFMGTPFSSFSRLIENKRSLF